MADNASQSYSEANDIPSLQPPHMRNRLTCTVREACRETGIGKTKMHALISGGALESIKIGRRRLVKVPSLLRLVDQGSSL